MPRPSQASGAPTESSLIGSAPSGSPKIHASSKSFVLGLYVNPPERAVVLAVDEKTQIQALDRTQPGLPLKKGRAGTMTND